MLFRELYLFVRLDIANDAFSVLLRALDSTMGKVYDVSEYPEHLAERVSFPTGREKEVIESDSPPLAVGKDDDVASIGLNASIFGYPLVEMLRRCRMQTTSRFASTNSASVSVNQLHHCEPAPLEWPYSGSGRVAARFTQAWIDLTLGPSTLIFPSSETRSRCSGLFLLWNACSEHIAEIPIDEIQWMGSTIQLVGPRERVVEKRGQRVVRSSTNLVRLVIEVQPDSRHIADTIAFQAGIQLYGTPGETRHRRPAVVEMWHGRHVDPFIEWAEGSATAEQIAPSFYANLCRALTQLRASTQDWAVASKFRRAGLTADADLQWHALDDGTRRALVRGFETAARWTALHRPAPDWAPANFEWNSTSRRYLERARATYAASSAERARIRFGC